MARDPPSGARSLEPDSYLSDLVAISPGVFQSERAGITRYTFGVWRLRRWRSERSGDRNRGTHPGASVSAHLTGEDDLVLHFLTRFAMDLATIPFGLAAAGRAGDSRWHCFVGTRRN